VDKKRFEEIENKIIEVLAKENCTIGESKKLLYSASKAIENSPTVQNSKNKWF